MVGPLKRAVAERSSDALANLRVTPWPTRDIKEPEVRMQDKTDGDEIAIETAAAAAPRGFRINASDLTTHRYTDGCPSVVTPWDMTSPKLARNTRRRAGRGS